MSQLFSGKDREGFRKCVAYRRKPFWAPNAYSVPEKALSGTECHKRQKGEEHCLQRMPQTPEKRSPVQKAQPGMPPRARKSQPKSLQYRPKSAQHLGLSITQDFIICHTVRLGLICRKILKITRQSVMILQINELSFYLFLLALSSLIWTNGQIIAQSTPLNKYALIGYAVHDNSETRPWIPTPLKNETTTSMR